MLHATVRRGRLVLDTPVELPEGQVVELQFADLGDALDETERAKLHRALLKSAQQADRGALIPAEEVLAELRGQR